MADTSIFIDGAAYERFMGRWSQAAGEAFIDWLALPNGSDWLDVGCGTGAFTSLIIGRCAPERICAIDPAEDQIDYAKTTAAAAKAAFRVGDAQALPYANGEFDAATMALVISFVPDPLMAVAEMTRVVKPGGTVATYMWDMLGGGFIQRPLFEALAAMGVKVPSLPGHMNSRREALQSFFETAGLVDIDARPIEIEVSYPDFEDYWGSQTVLVNRAVQAIREMDEPKVQRLKAHLRSNLPTDRSGRIAYPARANAIKGRVPR
jgi:ubiquinone/menaquinone biosynthesis C-methylase UbiE